MNTPDPPTPSLHLDEVWKQRSPDDKLKPLAMFIHHSQLALVYLSKSPLTSLLSVLSVGTVLFILGLVFAAQQASLFGLSTASGTLQMSVFIKDNFSDQDWATLEKNTKSLPGLTTQRRLDKAGALVELKKILTDSPDLLNGLEEDNPLPASLELTFDSVVGPSLASYSSQIKSMPGVESVAFDGQLIRFLSDLGSKLKGAGRFSLLVLICLTLFLIATTIRISLYHESDEIEIMNLVGAYPNFIQAPFIIGGALQGLIGSLLACLFLYLVQNKLLGVLKTDQLLMQASGNFALLNFQNIALLTLLGVGAGIVGSYLSSRQFR